LGNRTDFSERFIWDWQFFLVNEFINHCTPQYFISGKFDQFKRIFLRFFDSSVSGINAACCSRKVLTNSDLENKTLRSLRQYAQVIIDVIPEVERVMGSQPAIPELGQLNHKTDLIECFNDSFMYLPLKNIL
jgi:predicted ATPase